MGFSDGFAFVLGALSALCAVTFGLILAGVVLGLLARVLK